MEPSSAEEHHSNGIAERAVLTFRRQDQNAQAGLRKVFVPPTLLTAAVSLKFHPERKLMIARKERDGKRRKR